MSCAETAERLGCGLGWAEGSISSIVLASWRQCAHMGRHIGATWWIRLNRLSASAMWSHVRLLWPLVKILTNSMARRDSVHHRVKYCVEPLARYCEFFICRPHCIITCAYVAYCSRPNSVVCLLVGLSVCHTTEPCKNGWTDRDAVWVEDSDRPRAHVLDGSRSPIGRGNLEGAKGHPIVKYRDNTTESIEMPFGLWAPIGARNHVLDGGPDSPWEKVILKG